MTDAPLVAPAVFAASAADVPMLEHKVAATRSPFSGGDYLYAWPYAVWRCQIDVPARAWHQGGAELVAFLSALGGRRRAFLWSPFGADTPRGAGGSTTLAAAATAQATALQLAAPGAVALGDYLSIADRLYRCIAADGGVTAIAPPLRQAAAAGDAVVVTGARGCWRMDANYLPTKASRPLRIGGTFAFSEAQP